MIKTYDFHDFLQRWFCNPKPISISIPHNPPTAKRIKLIIVTTDGAPVSKAPVLRTPNQNDDPALTLTVTVATLRQ